MRQDAAAMVLGHSDDPFVHERHALLLMHLEEHPLLLRNEVCDSVELGDRDVVLLGKRGQRRCINQLIELILSVIAVCG